MNGCKLLDAAIGVLVLWGAANFVLCSQGNDQTPAPTMQLQRLQGRLAELEARVAELERRQNGMGPSTPPSPYAPRAYSQPGTPSPVPPNWSEGEFNGQKFYLIPLHSQQGNASVEPSR